MREVAIVGVGMTPFGKFIGSGIRRLSLDAIKGAFETSGLEYSDIDRVYFGNAIAGTVIQQDMIKAQVVFRHHPLADVPMYNFENACASGGSAFLLAVESVASGAADCVLALGAEQMHHVDKTRAFNALRGSTDIEEIGEVEPGTLSANSILMDFYAGVAQNYLDKYGASVIDFAAVAVKNRSHAVFNPYAYLRAPQTIDDVLEAREIVPPLTLPMCSPVTDGAAAVIVCSMAKARALGVPIVRVLASCNASGAHGHPVEAAARQAFEIAGIGAIDCNIFELHDAAAPAELMQYHEIGLCAEGQGYHLIRAGETAIGGRFPVNTSGGLLSRGHPLGATGCAQIYEIVTQLCGEAGARQVDNARLGLAVNGGGWLDGSYALAIATVLERV
ncbi:thiolase family protein [Novosphingobium sp. Fuku2-ISO-50]|uniref:thiolase family protein n=1 Tax=Novosphingobium sp. Fuku2-ISO-50 TaxID=1739114 RepID=UPI00076DBA20|nr:thiolase family protein [Novosphingobium sp. Fuku2-ISO-50]KUR73258.1 thiolase [Novosphingobium sp. Fuku2-ISO-50]